jgi:hypothetical protein
MTGGCLTSECKLLLESSMTGEYFAATLSLEVSE